MAKKRINHIFENGIEKKKCSRCREYKELGEFNVKNDRWDKLSNECFRCLSTRNKRRHDPDFRFPDEIQTRKEIQEYLDLVRYKKQKDINKGEDEDGIRIQKEDKTD